MNSPAEPTVAMETIELEPGLTAYRCPRSGGHWISEGVYWRWISSRPERLGQLPPAAGHDVKEEPGQRVRICPETGRLMTRYRVGAGFSFRIDRSPNGSIWLDRGEWEALKSRNYHDALLFVFTNQWQKEIVRNEQTEAVRRQFRERLGRDAYERALEFKKWLKQQPERELILCLLRDAEV